MPVNHIKWQNQSSANSGFDCEIKVISGTSPDKDKRTSLVSPNQQNGVVLVISLIEITKQPLRHAAAKQIILRPRHVCE